MQDRLLNAYLAGTVDQAIYKAKSNELKAEAARAEEALAKSGDVDPARAETSLRSRAGISYRISISTVEGFHSSIHHEIYFD